MTEISTSELEEARRHVWESLGRFPVRRAMLGRERSDAITRTALRALPTEELAAAGDDAATVDWLKSRTEKRVRALYSEQCGFAFLTFVILWAISAIVQVLVVRWWTRHRQEQPS
jgi:hypothetical protein